MITKTLTLLVSVLLLGACSKHAEPQRTRGTVPVPSGTATERVRPLPAEVEVFGTVRSVERASLAFRLMGNVESVTAALGQPVRAGEILARIHSADLEARLAQAKATLNTALRDVDREKLLADKGASTAETVRLLEDRLQGARAAVRELEVQLSFATLRAPFSGRISSRRVEPGDFVGAGQVVLEIEGGSAFEVDAHLPQSLALSTKVGDRIRLLLGDAVVEGTLREMAASADPMTRTVAVKVDVPAGTPAMLGAHATLYLPVPHERVLAVPASAVLNLGQLQRVFVAGPDGSGSRRLVKTGASRDGSVEVLSGLREGELVVLDAASFEASSNGELKP